MALPGVHALGPDDGSLEVRTYREGVAQKVGHDLIIAVTDWQGSVEVSPDGAITALALQIKPGAFEVREGLRGVKPLTGKDKAGIAADIEKTILKGEGIEFRSSAVEQDGGRLTTTGQLTLVGRRRPARFELASTPEGRLSGTLEVTQSEWEIKPYRAFMGALKVRDVVEVAIDVQLPPS